MLLPKLPNINFKTPQFKVGVSLFSTTITKKSWSEKIRDKYGEEKGNAIIKAKHANKRR